MKAILLEALYKVFPAEMHIRGREVCDAGEFTPGPRSISCSEK